MREGSQKGYKGVDKRANAEGIANPDHRAQTNQAWAKTTVKHVSFRCSRVQASNFSQGSQPKAE
jgi:hypothetical protein